MKRQLAHIPTLTLVLSLLSVGAAPAFAQVSSEPGVSASLSSREAYVGVPITLRIEIANATSQQPPTIPPIDGVRIDSLGAPSRSSQTTIINGRRTDRESVTYAWRVTPRHDGRFVIPALEVNVNGQTERTRPLPFVATKSETGDLLFAEVTGAEDAIYVGQALPVTLKIWVKPFRDPERGITLSEGDMWQFVSEDPTALGVFGEKLAEMAQNRQRPAGHEVLRTDSAGNEHSYYLYEIETTFYPKRPGAIDMQDVQVVVSYPTGLGRSRDLFSMFEPSLTVTGTRPIVADAKIAGIDVMPVPEEGRPADYRGAVGHYDIAVQASPTQVKAGDPITLHIGIHGDGPMELVQAPPLADLPELTKDFRVPSESLAGIVEDDVKVFSVSIRPMREGVAQIPAIPLTYFDPAKQEFVTVHSEPIPIQVQAADTLALNAVIGNAHTADSGESTNDVETLSFENTTDSSVLRSYSPWPMWPFVLLLVAGPIALAGTWFVRRFWLSEAGWVGPRLTRPLATARHDVKAAQTPHELADALLAYVAQRLDVPSGSLTRTEAIDGLLRQGNVDGLSELDELLAECEQATYAPLSLSNMHRLKERALNCLTLMNTPSLRSSKQQPSHHHRTLVAS